MWTTIITKVKSTVDGISQIKESYAYPLQGNPTKFPCIVFYPLTMSENEFDSTAENFKIFTLNLSVLVSLAGQTLDQVFTTTLPKIVDRVVEEFDEKWDLGTLDGHRMWIRASTGDIDYTIDKAGGVASMNMTLQVKLNTNN